MTDRQPDQPLPEDFQENAERSRDAGIADESAGYVNALDKDDSPDEDEDEAPDDGVSSEAPAEGSEDAAPRQPGSPG